MKMSKRNIIITCIILTVIIIGTSQLMVLDETAADYLISKYGLEEEDEQ